VSSALQPQPPLPRQCLNPQLQGCVSHCSCWGAGVQRFVHKMQAVRRTCLAQLSSISSLKLLKARIRLGRSPSGGSLVSLIEFCSRLMGSPRSRAGGGSADRNSLHTSGTRTQCHGLCDCCWCATQVATDRPGCWACVTVPELRVCALGQFVHPLLKWTAGPICTDRQAGRNNGFSSAHTKFWPARPACVTLHCNCHMHCMQRLAATAWLQSMLTDG
jgi:hypothetical protein